MKRFYIFHHEDGLNIKYLNTAGNWTDDFDSAWLLPDQEGAVYMATGFESCWTKWNQDSDRRYCIGCVEVSVDPYFPIVVIPATYMKE